MFERAGSQTGSQIR